MGNTNTNVTRHTVTHNGGACTIAGIAYNSQTSSSLEYEITVTGWVNYFHNPNNNYVGTAFGGDYTITKPTSSLQNFSVEYNITNESISVSFRTQDANSGYYALDLKKVN